MKNTSKFIVCSLTEHGAAVNATVDVADLFARRRRAGVEAVPVAVIYADVKAFKELTHILRLPTTITVNRAAVIFGQASIDPSVLVLVAREVREQGAKAAALLMDWQRAIQTAKEVAA